MDDLPGPPAAAPAAEVTLRVDKPSIGFSAAHFSIIDGRGEPIHGHNYRVSLTATGAVGPDGTLVDFASLKRALRAACAPLDNRMLLPATSPALRVVRDAGRVEVTETATARRLEFPEHEVVLLAVPNTTCECLAAHLLRSVRGHLGALPVVLGVGVEETPGQGATIREERPGGAR